MMTMAAPPRRGASRALGLLRFAASVVISLVLLVGVPVGLRAIAGNPLNRLPDVLAGDMSSGVVLAVLVAVLWVAWAQFVVAFVVELVAALRRAPVPARIRLPGFGVQQGLARALISGALLLAPVATTTIAPAAAVMAMPPAAAAAVVADSIPGQASSVSAPAGAVLTLTSDGARTWWDLANEHLGDGTQWRQLWDVNAGRVQADGTVMQSATTPLQIGWTVQLPAGVSAPAAADGATGPGEIDVTVEPGQTLSQIAEDHGQAWQDLWSANSGRVQTDGGVLNDPDYVESGWVITIPAPTEDSPQASLPGHDSVTVLPGQTLSEIAAAHGTDVAALMAANVAVTQADGDRLADPDVIETGWVLRIPGPSADEPTEQPTPADAGPSTTTPPTPGIGMPSADPGAAAPEATDSGPTAQAPAVEAAPPAQQPTAADLDPFATAQLAPGIGMPSADPGGAPTASDVTSSVTGTAPAPTGALAPAGQVSDDVVAAGQDDSSSSVSTIALFTGAGALFAALLLAALMRRRARQRGHRLPGELPGAHSGDLVDVERVLRAAGAAAAADAQWLDEALHGLGQLTAASGDGVLPDVLAVAVTADQLRLVLAAPSTATVGAWQVRDEGRQWVLARQAATGYDAVTRDALMPPFPTLVTVGATDSGEHWLLDLERIGAVTVTGDPVRSANLARFMAAELAHNSWSELLQVTLVGIGAEMADMYPERLTYADDPERALASATAQLRSIMQNDAEVLTGRTAPVGGEAFAAHVVLIDPSAVADQAPVDELIAAVTDHRDRSTVALVVASGAEGMSTGQPAWEIHVDHEGMLTIPELGLQLRAQQLLQAEAGLLSRMMAMAAGPGRWVRPTPAPDVIDSDVTPLPVTVDEATATTAQDHQVLTAPVPADVREHIVAGDAELNADLAQWADPASPYPRISFLGKVEVRPQGGASEPLPPLRAEVAVHLAVHSAGVSAERLTSDLWPTESSVDSRVRQHVYGLRKQLGANPSTGVEYLPRDKSGRYRLDGGVLIDGELFRRLRLRASIRDDKHLRVQDWWQALDLVRGIPFSGGRRDGYTWLADQRIDEEYQALIVDIAHQVATHHLSVGEPHRAEQAARRAMGAFDAAHAVPDICLLDMVWACDAQGRWAEGDSYVQRIIANYGTDIEDCPPRTFQILDRRQQQRAA